MKNLPIFLLLVTAVLLGLLRISKDKSPPSTVLVKSTLLLEKKNSSIVAPSVKAHSQPPLLNFYWSTIESQDYKIYITNLRKIGCPEEVVRDIILADVNKNYAPQEIPLKEQIAGMRSQLAGDSDSNNPIRKKEYEMRRQLRLVELEKQAFIKDLLNYEIPLEPLRGWRSRSYERYESALQTVPEEKRERVRRIQENYWYQSDLLREKYNSQRPPAYLEEYKRINDERSAQLGSLLSPAESENYEMRSTSFPSRLASELKYFKPNDDELRAIYKTMKEVEQPYGGGLTASSADDFDPTKHDEKKQAAKEKLRDILGEERFELFQKTEDDSYRNLARLAEAYDIPDEKLWEAYDVQAKTRSEALRNFQTLDGGVPDLNQNPEQLQAVRAETETKLKQIIGERAAKKFMANWYLPMPGVPVFRGEF